MPRTGLGLPLGSAGSCDLSLLLSNRRDSQASTTWKSLCTAPSAGEHRRCRLVIFGKHSLLIVLVPSQDHIPRPWLIDPCPYQVIEASSTLGRHDQHHHHLSSGSHDVTPAQPTRPLRAARDATIDLAIPDSQTHLPVQRTHCSPLGKVGAGRKPFFCHFSGSKLPQPWGSSLDKLGVVPSDCPPFPSSPSRRTKTTGMSDHHVVEPLVHAAPQPPPSPRDPDSPRLPSFSPITSLDNSTAVFPRRMPDRPPAGLHSPCNLSPRLTTREGPCSLLHSCGYQPGQLRIDITPRLPPPHPLSILRSSPTYRPDPVPPPLASFSLAAVPSDSRRTRSVPGAGSAPQRIRPFLLLVPNCTKLPSATIRLDRLQ
jgi:hypothetical protein